MAVSLPFDDRYPLGLGELLERTAKELARTTWKILQWPLAFCLVAARSGSSILRA